MMPLRVSPASISQLIHPVFEDTALEKASFIAQGLPASPGAATGEIVFTADRAKELHDLGKKSYFSQTGNFSRRY